MNLLPYQYFLHTQIRLEDHPICLVRKRYYIQFFDACGFVKIEIWSESYREETISQWIYVNTRCGAMHCPRFTHLSDSRTRTHSAGVPSCCFCIRLGLSVSITSLYPYHWTWIHRMTKYHMFVLATGWRLILDGGLYSKKKSVNARILYKKSYFQYVSVLQCYKNAVSLISISSVLLSVLEPFEFSHKYTKLAMLSFLYCFVGKGKLISAKMFAQVGIEPPTLRPKYLH